MTLKKDNIIFLQEQKWVKTFGGKDDDRGLDVKQTIDGGYIITGLTSSDVWLIKIDEEGNEQWNKTFGGKEKDWGGKVQQTLDDGYIIAGFTKSYGAGSEDFWLIKTDANGKELWNKTFGGEYIDMCYSVEQTSDFGYILAGFTRSFRTSSYDGWLVKTDINGSELWNRTFGWSGSDVFRSVIQISDGGYIVSGEANFFSDDDYQVVWLVRTDSNGIEKWNKTYLGTEFCYLRMPCSIQQFSDGYLFGGYGSQYSSTDDVDVLLIKTDLNGIMQWNKTFERSNYDRMVTASGAGPLGEAMMISLFLSSKLLMEDILLQVLQCHMGKGIMMSC